MLWLAFRIFFQMPAEGTHDVREPLTVALAKGVSAPVEGAEKRRVYLVKDSVALPTELGQGGLYQGTGLKNPTGFRGKRKDRSIIAEENLAGRHSIADLADA